MPPQSNENNNVHGIEDDTPYDEKNNKQQQQQQGLLLRPPPAATSKYGRSSKLIRAIPTRYEYPLSRYMKFVAWTTTLIVPSLFLLGPIMLSIPPFLYLYSPRAAIIVLIIDLLLAFYPIKQWPRFRGYFQMWYELFDFHHNLILPNNNNDNDNDNNTTTTTTTTTNNIEDESLLIYANHPHGVIPIHGYIWCAFCDQHYPNRYGFGALTDIALRLPFLRQVMKWLSSEPAKKEILLRNMEGSGTNLWILPGGVAEIFFAQPGRNKIKAKRRGMIKLALQTGALIIPTYHFGASDFYSQLATYGNNTSSSDNNDDQTILGKFFMNLSRSFKGGITFFWGQYGLPMPYKVKCTMVVGDPIMPVPGTLGEGKTMSGDKIICKKIPQPTEEQIDELMSRYLDALTRLFEQYKEQAGYPNAKLEIH